MRPNVLDALHDIRRSARRIDVQGTDDKRLVFEDERAWKWFGHPHDILEPFNDYSYEWFASYLDAVLDHVGQPDNYDPEDIEYTIEGFDVGEWADGVVDVYTKSLTEWLGSNAANVEYLTEAVDTYGAKTGWKMLSTAQYIAVSRLGWRAQTRLEELFEEEQERMNDEEGDFCTICGNESDGEEHDRCVRDQ